MPQCKAVCYKYADSIILKSGGKTEIVFQVLSWFLLLLSTAKGKGIVCSVFCISYCLEYNNVCSFSYTFSITLNN